MMSDRMFGMIDLALVCIVAIGLGVWQLVSINREIARDKAKRESPDSAGHPVGEHRLDDR